MSQSYVDVHTGATSVVIHIFLVLTVLFSPVCVVLWQFLRKYCECLVCYVPASSGITVWVSHSRDFGQVVHTKHHTASLSFRQNCRDAVQLRR